MVFSVRSHQQRSDSRAPLPSSSTIITKLGRIQTHKHQPHHTSFQPLDHQARAIGSNWHHSWGLHCLLRVKAVDLYAATLTAARRWVIGDRAVSKWSFDPRFDICLRQRSAPLQLDFQFKLEDCREAVARWLTSYQLDRRAGETQQNISTYIEQ
jgi:hypothetical protein